MKKIIAFLLAVVIVAVSFTFVASGARKMPKMMFGKDGKFTILQLTDMQDDHYPAHELEAFITNAVKTSNPDLVVITGDLVEDSRDRDIGTDDMDMQEGVVVEGDYKATLANVKKAVNAIFTPLEKLGVNYIVTQGNNDYSSGISNKDWLKIYASYPHCITFDTSNDKEGRIDNYVEILKYGSKKAGFGLWLLDNGRGFSESQKKWFKDKKTSKVPSIVFEHVPTSDVGNLFTESHLWEDGTLINQGLSGLYRLNPDIASGVCYIPYPPTGTSSDVFKMWKDKGVKGAFFGHIHTDGYTGTYDGITLGLTFGCQFAKGDPYGYRVIELDQKGTFETKLYTYEKGEFSLLEKEENTERNFIDKLFKGIFNIVSYPIRQVIVLLKQI